MNGNTHKTKTSTKNRSWVSLFQLVVRVPSTELNIYRLRTLLLKLEKERKKKLTKT